MGFSKRWLGARRDPGRSCGTRDIRGRCRKNVLSGPCRNLMPCTETVLMRGSELSGPTGSWSQGAAWTPDRCFFQFDLYAQSIWASHASCSTLPHVHACHVILEWCVFFPVSSGMSTCRLVRMWWRKQDSSMFLRSYLPRAIGRLVCTPPPSQSHTPCSSHVKRFLRS